MKKALKLLPIALLLAALFALSACGGGRVDTEGMRIALVAHSPESILDDGSFNAGAWQGIVDFANAHGMSTARGTDIEFFQAGSATDEARIDAVESAINWGASIIVMPGFHFIASSYQMQHLFPDTYFILLDATPGGAIANNLVAIQYAEHQSGFLAGYAAVREGYRQLGFMGGAAVPAVVRFGHGFLQGAEYAANSLGLAQGAVTVRFDYVGAFAPDPGVATQAGSWFAAGTEVIFAAAGGAGFSVMSAAETAGRSVIGVDVDQHADSDTVISSAMKALAVSVYDMLRDIGTDEWRGGQALMFDASVDGVGLPMDNSRWQNFTQSQYNAIFRRLANESIDVNNSLDMGDILPGLNLISIVD